MKNRLVKVFSHRRSGTNFLCGSLYINYYNSMRMRSKEDVRDIYFITDTGRKVKYNKWGDLFGGHRFSRPKKLDISRGVYILRDALDTAYSTFKWKDLLPRSCKDISFEEFLEKEIYYEHGHGKMNIVDHVKKHNENWIKSGICVVRFEDLFKDTVGILEALELKFNLKRDGPIKLLTRRVGWMPYKGEIGLGKKAIEEK